MSVSDNRDRTFFPLIALWFIIVAVAGFSRALGPRPEGSTVPLSVILHGAVFSSWLVLFLIQTLLIGKKKVKLHILLGQLSVLLVVAMAITGLYVSGHAAKERGIVMFGQQVKIVIVFSIFIFLGMLNRKKPNYHKRYMTFATISIMSPAVFRISLFGMNHHPAFIFIVIVLPILALIVYDLLTLHKLNKATIIGTSIAIGAGVLATLLFKTQIWINFAERLVKTL